MLNYKSHCSDMGSDFVLYADLYGVGGRREGGRMKNVICKNIFGFSIDKTH